MHNDLTFFTNDPNATLLDRFRKTLKDVKFFDVLVGYFRTSGFFRLYNSFETIEKVRILVGINVDTKTFEIIESSKSHQKKINFESHKRTKDIFSEGLASEMEHSEDTYDRLEWGTARAPARFCRPTFPDLYTVAEMLLAQRSPGPDPVVSCDDEKLAFTPASVGFVLWRDLAGVRNNSLKKVARSRGENPPRPDLPKREELEKTSRQFDIKYLLGVMNSSVAREFLRANRRSNIHLYPDDWKKLPIPDVTPAQQKPIVKFVDKIIEAKKADKFADVSALEVEIDKLACELYSLTPEAIAIVEGKR